MRHFHDVTRTTSGRRIPAADAVETVVDTVLSVPAAGSAPALRLRPWRSGDEPGLVAAHQDPVMRRWLLTSLADQAAARAWLDLQMAGWASGTRFSFAVVTEADDSAPLGLMVVTPAGAGAAEVGYWVAAHARSQGVASRGLEAVSQWALGGPFTRLELFHTVGNEASCRVAVRCGYPLAELVPPAPPAYPDPGHRHVRLRSRR
jgi:RimJ/RimL family protein N-acetyltransferase